VYALRNNYNIYIYIYLFTYLYITNCYLVTDASVVGSSRCKSEPKDLSRYDGAISIISVLSLLEGDGIAAGDDISDLIEDGVDEEVR
jgi:hypothetical protein